MKNQSSILKLTFLLVFLAGFSLSGFVTAQGLDSVGYEHIRFRPNFQLNNRRSLLNDELVQFWGFKVGVKLNKYHELGTSFTFMPYKLAFNQQVADSNFQATARLHFFSLYYEPTVLFKKRWEIDLPFCLGTGVAKVNYRSLGTEANSFVKNARVYVLEPSVVAYYRFHRYASLGIGSGYRKTLGPDRVINNSFSAPFFQAKIRLDFYAINKDYRKFRKERRQKKTTV